MATYAELADIQNQPGWTELVQKVRVAVIIKATAILEEPTPSTAAVDWAKTALNAPDSRDVLWYVVGANDNATINAILTASDATIQSNVDTAVDKIVSGGV